VELPPSGLVSDEVQEEDEEFRPANLQEGDVLDVKDTDRRWLLAKVLRVHRPAQPTSAAAPEAAPEPTASETNAQTTSAPVLESSETATPTRSPATEATDTPTAAPAAAAPVAPSADVKPLPDDSSQTYVYVHYEGWSPRWDEWLGVRTGSHRMAAARTLSVLDNRAGVQDRNQELDIAPDTITLICVHRRVVPLERFFINPFGTVLFGNKPLLLFVNKKTCTYADLYRLVWQRTQRYAPTPPQFRRFEKSASNDRTVGKEAEDAKSSVLSTDDSSSDGLWPPFVLKVVSRNGDKCFSCRWQKGCLGCRLPFSDEVLDSKKVSNDYTIAIDWNPTFLSNYCDMARFTEVDVHESAVRSRSLALEEETVTFGECMARFTAAEILNEIRCSPCKTWHDKTTKTLHLWSVPPVFVIHLKRLLPGKKIHTKVLAPLKNFDPTPFLATSILQQQEAEQKADSKVAERRTGLYDLYATVNHFGHAGGGHYTAYALNRMDNKWYLYDDSRVSALPEDHPIITENTYMLFYQKHGLEGQQGLDFLPVEAREKLEKMLKGSGSHCSIC
jgi:hypothetical protein